MSLPSKISDFRKFPQMYLRVVSFDTVSSFICGFDSAHERGILTGFREWLIPILERDRNMGWTELVLRAAFPDADSPRDEIHDSASSEHAIQCLFTLLDRFYEEAKNDDDLLRIFVRYQRWVESLETFDDSSPDYIP